MAKVNAGFKIVGQLAKNRTEREPVPESAEVEEDMSPE